MKQFVLALTASLFASVAYSGDMTNHQSESLEQATVVVYRNDSDIRSRRLTLEVLLGTEHVGRMRQDALVTQHPAGTYTLDTSLPGDEPIELQLQPGVTYYVQAGVSVHGGQVKLNLEEVGEQVARTEMGELPDSTI